MEKINFEEEVTKRTLLSRLLIVDLVILGAFMFVKGSHPLIKSDIFFLVLFMLFNVIYLFALSSLNERIIDALVDKDSDAWRESQERKEKDEALRAEPEPRVDP